MARRLLALLDGLLNLVTMLVVVVIGAYAGYALWDNEQIYAETANVQAELLLYKKQADEDPSRVGGMFEELRKINPDVRAWLTMDNTMIDYPVLQGRTNYSYLNTDVYGNFALAGSIFLDSRNDADFLDRDNLLHGHHMSNHRMFGDLDLYKDKTFFEENRTGTLILEDRTYLLRTFSVLYCLSNDYVIFNPDKWADDIREVLEYAKETSLYKDSDVIERLLEENELASVGGKEPQIIVMATCSVESDASRFVLLAEMIPSELAENGEEEP